MDKEMMAALEADGEKLRQLTGEDHGPVFLTDDLLTDGFLTARYLEITEPERAALIKTLELMESGGLVHVPDGFDKFNVWRTPFTGHFNMEVWRATADCGTVACIGGTAEMVGQIRFGIILRALDDLLYPPLDLDYGDITVAQAATALRNYLTAGEARWLEVV